MRKLRIFLISTLVLFCFGGIAYAEWQIQYTGEAARMFGSTPRGHFATKDECQAYWESSPVFEQNHSKCVGCDSPKGGGGGNIPFGGVGGYGSSEDFAKQQIIGGMIGMVGNLLAEALNPQDDTAYQEKLLWQQKQAAIKKEAERKEGLEKWKNSQKKSALQKEAEGRQKKEEGAKLLSEMDTVSSNEPLRLASAGGGHLESFKLMQPQIAENELQPLGTGRYDTSALSSCQRLLCAAHFSESALAAAKRGDDVNARYLNEQAEKVMSGQMIDLECQFPDLPAVPEPPKPQSQELRGEMAYYESMIKSVQQDARKLQDIEIKLKETDEKIKQAEEKKQHAEQRITEIQSRAATTEKPEEKQELDGLLAQARQLEQESIQQLQEATDERQKHLDEKENITNKLKELQKGIQQSQASN